MQEVDRLVDPANKILTHRCTIGIRPGVMRVLDLHGYKLTFDDEFNARSISFDGAGTTWADTRAEWRIGGNAEVGFGRSSFVDPKSGYDPFKVGHGVLSITAVPDRTSAGVPGSWESGLITTQGGFSQRYGYFEMRADLAGTPGGWDAFWMLPDQQVVDPNGKGRWQELDIVEHYGVYDKGTYRWMHTTDEEPNKNPNADLQVFSENPEQTRGYHTYGMDWQQDEISFYFDGQFMGSKPTPSDMHGPMYILANLATQDAADKADVPMTMKIDYIRAYSNAADAVSVKLDNVSAPDNRDPGLYGATSRPDTVTSSVNCTLPSDVKNLVLTGARAVNGTGNILDNSMTGNSGKNVLDGRAGADTMKAGLGDDTYVVDNVRDKVIELPSQGTDTVKSSVGYLLPVNVENLTLVGSGALSGTGNAVANTLIGNGGANALAGLAGHDVLTGGGGADMFVFRALGDSTEARSGRDLIRDFSHGQHDRIDLHLIDADTKSGGDQAFRYVGEHAFTKHAGELRAVFSGAETLITSDVNGDAKSDFSILVHGHVTLQSGDFLL